MGTFLKCNIDIEKERQKTERQKDNKTKDDEQDSGDIQNSRRPPMTYSDRKWREGGVIEIFLLIEFNDL